MVKTEFYCLGGDRPVPQFAGGAKTMDPVGSSRGFTMVELVMAMAITGALVFMAAPYFSKRNSFESRGFYDQVLSTLRYAQKAAIAQNRYVCVAFTANSVTLTTGADSLCTVNPGGSTSLSGPTGAAPYSVSGSNTSFSSIPAGFSFDAQGRPAASAVIAIQGVASITVEAETGYVH